jgi:hypothetical protein
MVPGEIVDGSSGIFVGEHWMNKKSREAVFVWCAGWDTIHLLKTGIHLL